MQKLQEEAKHTLEKTKQQLENSKRIEVERMQLSHKNICDNINLGSVHRGVCRRAWSGCQLWPLGRQPPQLQSWHQSQMHFWQWLPLSPQHSYRSKTIFILVLPFTFYLTILGLSASIHHVSGTIHCLGKCPGWIMCPGDWMDQLWKVTYYHYHYFIPKYVLASQNHIHMLALQFCCFIVLLTQLSGMLH